MNNSESFREKGRNETRTRSKLKIRSYCSEDREAVRTICKITAFRNRGYSIFFEDGELFADYWTDAYLRFEPDLCFVAEKEGKVVGYLLGCSDSNRFFNLMKKKILPELLIKLLSRLLTFRYRDPQTFRSLRWAILKSRKEFPLIPLDRFPAHFHANIMREGSFQQGYSTLLLRFLDELEKRSVPGLYGIVLEPVAGGTFSKLFSKVNAIGLKKEYYSESPSSMYKFVLHDQTPMVNRVYASSLEIYRGFVHYISKCYNL